MLTALAVELQQKLTLERLLQLVVQRSARLVDAPRVSIRLFDETRTRLVARCRAGDPLHLSPVVDFALGEGLIGWIAQNARPLRTGNAEKDARFHPRSDIKEPLASFLGVPLMAGESCIGVLSANSRRRNHFTAEHEQMLTLLAAMSAPHVEMARLARIAQLDPLTGVLNRHALELALPNSPPVPLAVALCDVDRFKAVNDDHGHAAGDIVLRGVATQLASSLRGGDTVLRYGGEEFLLVLPGADLEQASSVAERARRMLEAQPFPLGGASVRVTASFGVAERNTDEDRDALMARADQALYAAKQAGRNRVELAR
jgi:diguanylate cyclase (GGDEF)-like protein